MPSKEAPVYFVSVRKPGKQAEPINLSDKVTSFSFEDNERKADKLLLTVDNFDLRNFDDPVWAHGNILQFSYGFESGLAPLREGTIRKVTGGQTITIEAHAKSVLMDRLKVRQAYENKTRSEVAEIIAKRNGYMNETILLEDTKERFEIITQNNQTDAEMLRKLADLQGFEFFVDFDGLHWHIRDLDQAPIREIRFYTDQGQGDVIGFTVENDITRKPGRVRVRSRDPLTKEPIVGLADNESDTERTVLQEIKALEEFILEVDAESGATTESSRKLSDAQPVANESDVPSNAQTQEEANTEAKKRFRKSSQRAVKMSLDMVGDPNIMAKSVVLLSGFGARLSGKYYIKAVSHRLDGGSGYTMSLKLITDGYQRKYGGGGKGQGNATGGSQSGFQAALASLGQALQSTTDVAVLSAGAQVVQNGVKAIQAGLPKSALNQVASGAMKLARFVKGKAQAGSPESAAFAGVFAAASSLSALAKRMANQEDVAAKGKVNTKDVTDARELKQKVSKVDPETGQTFTAYVPVGSRGKK